MAGCPSGSVVPPSGDASASGIPWAATATSSVPRCSQRIAAVAPETAAARRTISPAWSPSSSAAASASPASSSAGRASDSAGLPAPKARSTSSAWAAQSSAAKRSSLENGSPTRRSSSETAASPARTRNSSDAPASSAARRVAAGARSRSSRATRRQLLHEHPRPGELRRERRRAGDGRRLELGAARHRDPDERDIGAGERARNGGDLRQRLRARPCRSCGGHRAHERRE